MVVWSHVPFYSSIIEILGQRLNESGAVVGVPVKVNSFVAGQHRDPRVLHHRGNDFTVVWRSVFDETPKRGGVQVRRFDGHGRPEGNEFRVTRAGQQGSFTVDAAHGGSGDLIVVWVGEQKELRGRWFDGRGHPISEELVVADSTVCDYGYPRVAGDSSGNFLIVWQRGRCGPSPPQVYARRLNPGGRPAGRAFRISRGSSEARVPQVSSTGPLEFVVVWQETRG